MVAYVEHDYQLVALEDNRHTNVHVDAHFELTGPLNALRPERRMPRVSSEDAQLVVNHATLDRSQLPIMFDEVLL